MELKILHIYPDLMSLYGSYANLSVLGRYLEALGHTVTVETLLPAETPASLTDYDFVFLGAGTERAADFALEQMRPWGDALCKAAADGLPMLFAGTAMELLGKSITAADGRETAGLGLAEFVSQRQARRIVGDVFGPTELFDEVIVGFMNKCTLIRGVDTPLLTRCDMGFGNEAQGGAEGYHKNNVFASELTGPLLVKNPRLLDKVAEAICLRRGLSLPEEKPVFPYAQAGYAITAEQLRLRLEKEKSGK
ncbi:hypothetical protein [uncultured Oscillibacter sp.]|uniref:hypothetical protein n=1 Tax=uncultured Oscillibacter sp. TaxID=876091 RepID=UPI0025D39AAD|nr:hypothetical protein [uncultured Oscillibacter sp.]